MSKTFFLFSSQKIPFLQEVGGKAQSLIVMTQEKFPVPTGFVLAVGFFQPWFEKVEKSAAWKRFLKSSEAGLKKNCDALKKSCLGFKLTAAQKRELQSAVKKMPKKTLFAVRSSSPEEDLEGTSFAGGYETSLGVTVKTLEQAILHSFVSVYDERIVKYKMQHGMKTDNPRIAVIVQQQIASEVSGVAFSLNPQNNCYDEVVINSSFGLGETIVSGQVTPDSFIVEMPKKKFLEKNIAHKSHALWLTKDGGTEERDNLEPKKASLTSTQVKEVARLVKKVEKYFDKPMDIEWAYAKKKLYLLQARPITAYLPLPPEMITKPGAQKYLYQDALLMEQGIQEPMSIMGTDIYNDMIKVMVGPQMSTALSDPKKGIMMTLHGKAYLNASNTIKALGKSGLNSMMGSFDVPTGKIMEKIDYEEYIPKKTPKELRGLIFKLLPILSKTGIGFLRVYFSPKKVIKKYKRRYRTDIKRIDDLQLEGRSFQEVSKEVINILVDHMLDIFDVLMGPLYSRWRLGRIFKGNDINDLLVRLQMNLPGNPTAKMGREMYALAKMPEIRRCKNAKIFAKKIREAQFSPKVMKAYEQYMKEFGFRCIREIDPATPRPYEDPEQFFQQLSLIHISAKGQKSLLKKSEEQQKKAYAELKKIAKNLGKEDDLKYHADMIRNLAGYREVPKYVMVKLIDVLRRKALEIGEQLKKEGRLDQVEDVFSLKTQELFAAEVEKSMDLKKLVEKNTSYTRRVAHRKDWPRVVDSRGKIFRAPREDVEGAIVGDAISPGVIRGRVKILDNPYDKPLKKGEILVTRATDPGWTPLFMNAGAVVLEVGGVLQHGAVIAREYGLPCVSGVEGAATRFQDGQLLEVNGSEGTVRVIEDTV